MADEFTSDEEYGFYTNRERVAIAVGLVVVGVVYLVLRNMVTIAKKRQTAVRNDEEATNYIENNQLPGTPAIQTLVKPAPAVPRNIGKGASPFESDIELPPYRPASSVTGPAASRGQPAPKL